MDKLIDTKQMNLDQAGTTPALPRSTPDSVVDLVSIPGGFGSFKWCNV